MPNMFGGDQFHPAYMPTRLKPNEVMVGNIVYRIEIRDGLCQIFAEDVEGQCYEVLLLTCPQSVKDRCAELLNKRQV